MLEPISHRLRTIVISTLGHRVTRKSCKLLKSKRIFLSTKTRLRYSFDGSRPNRFFRYSAYSFWSAGSLGLGYISLDLYFPVMIFILVHSSWMWVSSALSRTFF